MIRSLRGVVPPVATVRVLAGRGFGAVSPLQTQHPVIPVTPTATALAPIFGTMLAGTRANGGSYEPDAFVLASEPIGEPIARYGPFGTIAARDVAI